MSVIHPDVAAALAYADTVRNHLLDALDQLTDLTSERLSADRDIAVKVDTNGQLVDLWFKPGLLDRKTAKEISREVTRLITDAGAASAATAQKLFAQAHNYPSFEEFSAADPGSD
jgi:hypothetical protein